NPDELLFATLLRSYESTKKLKVELITLVHSIRIFQNKLGKTFDTNNVLHSYFDVYKTKISDRYYHPLKTFDSVAKFKRPVIRILERWLQDKSIREKMITQSAVISPTNDKREIEKDIISKINYITDTYETINDLISSIDKENSVYTKSSANKILYLNNSDRTIKGHLENIFKYYGKNINDGRILSKILSQMQDASYFDDQGYISSQSVSLPLLRRMKLEGEPLEIVDFDVANDVIMENFLRETSDIYTDERIYGFMQKAFGSDRDLKIIDVPLPTFEAFICLILATIKKDDESCFYTVEIVDDIKIRNGDYIVPNLIFHRKENT
ncbi:MAG: Wadjet anti-phage system protein JetA family protein, partial [Acholeplasmataceae bacterium]